MSRRGTATVAPCGRPRSAATRKRILAASVALLQERGFRAMTIEGIAERAHAGKVTIYRWWPSKAAVVLEALLEGIEKAVTIRETAQPLDDLRAYMEDFAELIGGPFGDMLAGLIAESVLDPAVGEAYRNTWQRPRRAEARKIFTRAMIAQQIPAEADVESMLDMFFAPIYYRLIMRHQPVSREFARTLWSTVMLGLTAQHKARSPTGGDT